MLFSLSVNADGRLILDDLPHGGTLAVIEAETWREARRQVWREPATNPFEYRTGHGWFSMEMT